MFCWIHTDFLQCHPPSQFSPTYLPLHFQIQNEIHEILPLMNFCPTLWCLLLLNKIGILQMKRTEAISYTWFSVDLCSFRILFLSQTPSHHEIHHVHIPFEIQYSSQNNHCTCAYISSFVFFPLPFYYLFFCVCLCRWIIEQYMNWIVMLQKNRYSQWYPSSPQLLPSYWWTLTLS